jgi:phospholipase D1/2
MIYVHSKLIIVDDKYTMIGSANINDRSMIGERDSEVNILIEDSQFSSSTMNDQSHEAGVFAGSIRKQLFREHLGLLEESSNRMGSVENPNADINVDDPITVFEVWNNIAGENARLYEEVSFQELLLCGLLEPFFKIAVLASVKVNLMRSSYFSGFQLRSV